MRLDKVTVKNFRNLAEIGVPLQRGTVLVGENRVGKSSRFADVASGLGLRRLPDTQARV